MAEIGPRFAVADYRVIAERLPAGALVRLSYVLEACLARTSSTMASYATRDASKAREWFLRERAISDCHAVLVEGYERRFGEFPRGVRHG
ncbi:MULTISPECIES: hypothetical protein [unclassified Mesorhizobium]|uniref:hypothetical protein n=1 Tax=unclassified Mesorhizobium TaxID=325217 RepID=UPI000F7617F4|nr:MULTISPECIES: hypothetical protein [unclassified Mesorhizobium]AZO04567.1 hypothetical protein EJ068_16980 [Mesorhizobium sp. M2A.F.Ca.ET.043.02.1.1]RUW72973.1 hypothetical protein EOA28_19555 [Mesorhizobium sp. M2A.F.Ca.ET.067.02.1.1]TIU57140.1 MAG: hypothetical protein E5W35_10365 [Mesorhizobium sp.]